MATNNSIDKLKGTWNYIRGENFDGILKELGVNKVLRTLVKTIKPHFLINEKDGKWSYKQESKFHTTSYEFLPDIEFEDTTPEGEKINVIIHFENGKWIQTVHYKDGKELLIERSINNQDQMEVKMKCGKAESFQVFGRHQ